MALRSIKPTSPGRRGMVVQENKDLSPIKPKKSLLVVKHSNAGRNSTGKITVRHRGSGHKRRIRIIDFKRDKFDVPGIVDSIEYDPNRSARIALIKYADGDWRYIIAPLNLTLGDTIISSETAEIKVGNSLPLGKMPAGTQVHNIEMTLGKGGQIVRSAGGAARIQASEGRYTLLRLPSGEVRQVLNECRATVGQVGSIDHKNVKIGKAGRKRNMGWRPSVRGLAMAPNAHPHGGGEGRSSIGLPGPKTPWGKPALGRRTRGKKSSDRLISSRRYKK